MGDQASGVSPQRNVRAYAAGVFIISLSMNVICVTAWLVLNANKQTEGAGDVRNAVTMRRGGNSVTKAALAASDGTGMAPCGDSRHNEKQKGEIRRGTAWRALLAGSAPVFSGARMTLEKNGETWASDVVASSGRLRLPRALCAAAVNGSFFV